MRAAFPNLAIVVLYIINAWTRGLGAISQNTYLVLSIIGIIALLFSGWLGGKMVYEAGVAVHADDAEGVKLAGTRTTTSVTPGRGATGGGMPRMNPDRAMASDRSPRETDRS